MKIVQSASFAKQLKKLYKNQKIELDVVVALIIQNPDIGTMKKGDLGGVRVYKFKMVDQLTLLAYSFDKGKLQLFLIALGSHENFYRDLIPNP
jgi:mRNA-degrading endonuclease YafQ of YafQ-DinJ toxin-antitoxin module